MNGQNRIFINRMIDKLEGKKMKPDFTKTNFAGSDYNPDRDMMRMADGMAAVFAVMKDQPHRFFTLEELAELSGVPQSSVGSYLCYMRRDYYYEVPKVHVGNGLWSYCLGNKRDKSQVKKQKATKDKPYDIITIEKEHDVMKQALLRILQADNTHDVKDLINIAEEALYGEAVKN